MRKKFLWGKLEGKGLAVTGDDAMRAFPFAGQFYIGDYE
jgi:hypothetical protein